MSFSYLLPTLLSLHLISLVIMAGTTLIDYVTLRKFWTLFAEGGKEKSIGLLEATASFSRLIGIGAAALIVTGLLMMVVTHGVFGEQLWFRIKFGLVIALVANGIFVGRRLGLRLRKTLSTESEIPVESLAQIRKNGHSFYLSQLLLFILIIILSIFKFN